MHSNPKRSMVKFAVKQDEKPPTIPTRSSICTISTDVKKGVDIRPHKVTDDGSAVRLKPWKKNEEKPHHFG